MQKHSTSEWLFALIIAVGIVTPIAMIANAVAIVRLWSWFVVDTFNVQPLATINAMGLAVLIGLVVNGPTEKKSEEKDPIDILLSAAVTAVLRPLIAVIIGGIVHAFI